MSPPSPLTETTFFILLSLADGPKHGYAILKTAADLSDGRIEFSTGTLYGALKRLLDAGWIAPEDSSASDVSRGRKDYRLTPAGRRALQAETRRLQALVRLAGTRLGSAHA